MNTRALHSIFLLTVFTGLGTLPVRAWDDIEKVCQTRASVAMKVSRSNVSIRRGENLNDGSGSYIVLWEARLRNNARQQGYCVVDPRQRQIVRFESNEYRGGSSGYVSRQVAERTCQNEVVRRLNLRLQDVGTDVRRPSDDGTYRVKWYTDFSNGNNSSGVCEVDQRGSMVRFDQDGGMGGGPMGGGPVGDYPRVKLDTGGDGMFNGGRFRNVRLQRAALDTRESRATLTIVGHNFRIAFYGEVIRANSDRDLTLRIESSDHGNARGRAQVRLNPDRNEMETLDFRGTMDGSELTCTFVRGH